MYFIVGYECIVYMFGQCGVWWQVQYVVVVEKGFCVGLVEDGV